MSERFYRFVVAIARAIVWILFPLRISGLENIPQDGAGLLCINHISMLDPVLVGCGVRRGVRFMAKAELFKMRWLDRFLRAVGAFPVKRGESDMASLRTSLGILKDGQLLGIFPQGHRDKTGELGMETGVGLLALRSGATVIPVMLLGDYRPFRRFPIVFGPPVDLSAYAGRYDSEMLKLATADIERAVRALAPSQSGDKPSDAPSDNSSDKETNTI